MADFNFTNLPDHLARAQINFASDTFKVLLVTSVPSETNRDTWVDRADVTNEVAAGGGYTQGGLDLTVAVNAVDTANKRVAIDIDPSAAAPQYTSSTISAYGMIVYKSTGTPANDLLVSFVDFNGVEASSGGNFTISFDTPLYINA